MSEKAQWKLLFVATLASVKGPLFCSFTEKSVREAVEANPGATFGKPDVFDTDAIPARAEELMKGWTPEDRAILQLHFAINGGINPIPKPKVEAKKPAPKASPTPVAAKKAE